MQVLMPDTEGAADLRISNATNFSVLYEQYAEMLIQYAAARLLSFDEAHDMVHDLFVQVWEDRQVLVITHSFKAFLFACLKRRILNYHRKTSFRQMQALHLKKVQMPYTCSTETYMEYKQMKGLLNEALEVMSVRIREIYLLSKEAHLSNKQIALRLQISEQTVKNQLYKATKIIRRFFVNSGFIS